MATPKPETRVAPADPPHGADDDGAAALSASDAPGHLSETVEMAQWLRLLVVTTTTLMLLLFVAVVVRLCMSISHTLLLFSLGGLVAYALDPLVEWARRRPQGRRAPRWTGVLTVFATLAGVVLLGIAFLGVEMSLQGQRLARDRVQIEAHARETLADMDRWLATRNIHIDLEDYLDHPPPNLRVLGGVVSHDALKSLGEISKAIVEGMIVLLIALFFLIYNQEMGAGFNRALPERLRPYAGMWQNDVNRILGGFVRGQAVLALTIGAMAAVACLLLGVKFWLLIGLFVVIASLVPVFGPYIGAIPAVIAAAFTPGGHFLTPLLRAILVLILFLILNEVGSKILYPRLVGAALGLHEVLVLFVLFAGLEVGRIWGVLFAAPLTALSIVSLVHLYRLWHGLPPISVAQAAQASGARAKAHGTP
jgi:predicted PurR-regulated permease PerM